MTEKRIFLIYAHHISYKNIRNFAVSLNPIIIQNWIKKNVSKVPTTLLKSNFEFEGLKKFKMILIVYLFKILSNH